MYYYIVSASRRQWKGDRVLGAKNNTSTYDNPYLGAYSLVTTHGMCHVQSAGLQQHAKHGVFHTLGQESRIGGRVALTSRVCYADSCHRVKMKLATVQGTDEDCFQSVLVPTATVSIRWK